MCNKECSMKVKQKRGSEAKTDRIEEGDMWEEICIGGNVNENDLFVLKG